MRTGLFLFFFIMTGFCASAFAGQGEELFAQAVQKYQSGDYAAAIDLNERILKEAGVESASVYFNLGNSYFRNGELGRAIANYLRVRPYSSMSPRGRLLTRIAGSGCSGCYLWANSNGWHWVR